MNCIYQLVWNAETQSWSAASELSRVRKKRTGVKRLALASALSLSSLPALANPEGASLVAGAASVQSSLNQLTVNQSTDKAIINWNSFSIDAHETTTFVQPSANSVTLNRVVGQDPSQILGSLQANGKLFLVNPNGIVFGKTATVDVNGLVATTFDITDDNFLNGNFQFNLPGKLDASVINEGTITIHDAGIAAFVAPAVRNDGLIAAQLGKVTLASGTGFTLDLYGDQLVELAVDPQTLQAFTTGGQPLNAFVDNTGEINAQTIVMTASAARDAVDSVINMSGVIHATSFHQEGGEIVIGGDASNGTINVSGTLDASATNQTESADGGRIIVYGEDTTITSSAELKAEASKIGGDGGFIETSGLYISIGNGAYVSTSAQGGKVGTWLIDPFDFVISSGNDAQTPTGIGASTLESNLLENDIRIVTNASGSPVSGTITVDGDVSWSANKLTLAAHKDILINATLNATGTASLAFEYGLESLTGEGSNYTVSENGRIFIPTPSAFTWKKGTEGTTSNLVLDNGLLRFGNGFEASLSLSGQLLQPWYYDNTTVVDGLVRDDWYALTYYPNDGDYPSDNENSAHPVDYQIGLGGDGSSEWNRNGEIIGTGSEWEDTGNIASLTTSRWLDISGYTEGVGTIKAMLTVSSDLGVFNLSNEYSLVKENSYIEVASTIANIGQYSLDNLRLWVGTRDDYIGEDDGPIKTKGILSAEGFSAISSSEQASNAIKIDEYISEGVTGASVIFYSNDPGVNTAIEYCCSFDNVSELNPIESVITDQDDGSYALFKRFSNLAPGQSQTIRWYYAAGSATIIDQVIDDVAQNSGLVSWDGGADSLFWGDRFNWSGDTLPGVNSQVTIGSGYGTISLLDLNVSLDSLVSYSLLDLNNSTLSVTNSATLYNGLSMSGMSYIAADSLVLEGANLGTVSAPIYADTNQLTFSADGEIYLINNDPRYGFSSGYFAFNGDAVGTTTLINYGATVLESGQSLSTTGAVSITAKSPLSINGALSAGGNVNLTAANGGALSIGGSVSTTAGAVNLTGGSVSGNIPAGAIVNQTSTSLVTPVETTVTALLADSSTASEETVLDGLTDEAPDESGPSISEFNFEELIYLDSVEDSAPPSGVSSGLALPVIAELGLVDSLALLYEEQYTPEDRAQFYDMLSQEQVVSYLMEEGQEALAAFFDQTAETGQTTERQLMALLNAPVVALEDQAPVVDLFTESTQLMVAAETELQTLLTQLSVSELEIDTILELYQQILLSGELDTEALSQLFTDLELPVADQNSLIQLFDQGVKYKIEAEQQLTAQLESYDLPEPMMIELLALFSQSLATGNFSTQELLALLNQPGLSKEQRVAYLGVFVKMREIAMQKLLSPAIAKLIENPGIADVVDEGTSGGPIDLNLTDELIKTKDGLVKLTGQVKSDSKLLTMRVNGRWAYIDEEGRYEVTVPVQQGSSEIKVEVFDPSGKGESRVLQVESEITGEYRERVNRRIALLIGVEEYDGAIPELETPLNDANVISGRLQADQQFETLTLANPTKDELIAKLQEISKGLEQEDSLMVFYAGHGYMMNETGRGYWLPRDASPADPANWVSNRDVARIFHRTPAKQIMMVSDSCYSGAFTNGRALDGELQDQSYIRLRAVMGMSSGGDQPVWDGGADGHSIFASKLIETLPQGEFKGLPFYQQVRDKVVAEAPQVPGYGAMIMPGYDVGADFVLNDPQI